MEIDEAEAEIVDKIFALAQLGRGAAAVARVINKEKLVRRNGQPWTQRQVAAVLARATFYRDGRIRYGPVTALNEKLALLRDVER